MSTPPQPNPPKVITSPYGTGATFTWGQGDRIPQPGDADYPAYSQALNRWFLQQEQIYRDSPRYQADQAQTNPDISSGRVPAVGFTASGVNPWGIPEGGKVASLQKQEDGGYQIAYQPKGTPQRVTVSGPGYGYEGTVNAPNAKTASQIVYSGYQNQTMGVDTSPSRIGEFRADIQNNRATLQAGDPERNRFWINRGLPQYAGYFAPELPAEQKAEGFYIKDIAPDGAKPKVTLGNTQWENFWTQQGNPELSNYKPPALSQGQYIFSPRVDTEGNLNYKIGNVQWERQWRRAGVADVNIMRGYEPPSIQRGQRVVNPTVNDGVLTYEIANRPRPDIFTGNNRSPRNADMFTMGNGRGTNLMDLQRPPRRGNNRKVGDNIFF